jgi:hypothetical protein
MLIPARVEELTYFALFMLIIGLTILRARMIREIPPVRRIAGLEALEEAVGRATEMGRPVFLVPGAGDVTDSSAVDTLAGLAILERTAELCAEYDARLIVTITRPNVYPIAHEIVRQASVKKARPNLLRPDTVQFLSEDQFAWSMGTVALMHSEKVASAILVGLFRAESLLLAEAAGQLNAITIGGCARIVQIPYFIVACDYCLIGEELMVAGAYLSREPIQLGAVRGQDLSKILMALMILAGSLAASFKK